MNVQGIIPAIAAPILGLSANNAATAAGATSSSSNSSSSTTGLSSNDLESTFLNLLVTELQNQDPTQPVDPTEMVSQMVSLNQLDQLISINQTLQNLTSGTTGTTTSSGTTGQTIAASGVHALKSAPSPADAATNSGPAAIPAFAGAAANSGPMNLYSSFGLPAATTNSIYTGAR